MPKPKKILNDPSKAVSEFIDGLLLQYPHQLVKLQNHNVVLSTSSKSKVQLISGGGSGHEPSHAGWLGDGMLRAAVCGGIFASPSVSSIAAAIRAVAASGDETGVLAIVKNYTGDRLNFGMAVEQACGEGIACEMVVIADDAALPRTKGITGARGVAGTVLVHKIAGAAAAAGKLLTDVASVARSVSANMGSMGVALDAVTVPGAEQVNDRLADADTIELGLGIHGEAGLRQSKLLTADEIAKEMVDTIQAHGRMQNDKVVPLFESGDEVCLLVNNLGGTSNFEMSILARSCVQEVEKRGAKATRVLVGSFMTSFDMHGASLTILNLQSQDDWKEWLDAPTTAPAWHKCDVWNMAGDRPSATELPEVVVNASETQQSDLPAVSLADFSTSAKTLLSAAVEKLSQAEPLLTKYDTIVGDGDCGLTMKRGADEVQKRLQDGTIPVDHPATMFASVADAVSASMGGTSGVLVELFFRKMASTLRSSTESIDVPQLTQAFQAGVNAVSLYGGAHVGSRTMLDSLVPAAEAAVNDGTYAAAAAQARQGADSTAAMKTASAGRSNYLSEDTLTGTPDPGAIAVAIVLEALAAEISK